MKEETEEILKRGWQFLLSQHIRARNGMMKQREDSIDPVLNLQQLQRCRPTADPDLWPACQ